MTCGVRWYLVGSLVLLALAGCGRSWFDEREPWRREAEEQCLKSGSVKQGPAVALMKPIQGPGVCGADYPLRVAALGETTVLGYANEPLRPPGVMPPSAYPASDPIGYPRAPVSTIPPAAPPPRYAPSPDYAPATSYPQTRPPRYPNEPISLTPPGRAQPGEPGLHAEPPPRSGVQRQSYPPPQSPYGAQPPSSPRATVPATSVPLSPTRATPLATGTVTAAVTPEATLACPLVSALDQWVTTAVQPAALKWFGQQVVEIRQISAYSCRGMNGNAHARISEHAFGNALDIAAFTLADGRKVTVKDGWRGAPEEQGFLRDVQAAACAHFSTVLAPGSNVYHYDHMHVDLMRRASGSQICNPAAVSGEDVASRARGRYASRPFGEPGVTGSTAAPRMAQPAKPLGYGVEADDIDDDRPHALPPGRY